MNTYTHKVQYYETDKMQITHHSNYIRFMEEARIAFLEQAGFGYDKLEEMGIVSPVVSVTCDYKKTTTFADTIAIEVVVQEVKPLKLFLAYTMTVRGEVVCAATSVHCFLDADGKPIVLKKQYPEFYETLKKLEYNEEL